MTNLIPDDNKKPTFLIRAIYLGNNTNWANSFKGTGISLNIVESPEELIKSLKLDSDIDIVIFDTDIPYLYAIIENIKEQNLRIPIITISPTFNQEKVMEIMQLGSKWHFHGDTYENINVFDQELRKRIFKPTKWDFIFRNSSERNLPYLEFGLINRNIVDEENLQEHSAMQEEEYVLKKLFPQNHRIHVFQLTTDEQGLSGARVYRVQADDETMRIVKIETLSGIETIEEKFEKLIRPRINQYIGRMEPNLVRAKTQGGAKYILAGSYDDSEIISIKAFMSDQNSRYVRPSSISELLEQIHGFLRELYVGHIEDRQTRFWAEFYTRILPPQLVISNAKFINSNSQSEKQTITIKSNMLRTYGAVYEKRKEVYQAFQEQQSISVYLKDFEVIEIDPEQNRIYVQDAVAFHQKARFSESIASKDLPLIRIKIQFGKNQKALLMDPILRKGKKINIVGISNKEDSQEEVLKGCSKNSLGKKVDKKSLLCFC